MIDGLDPLTELDAVHLGPEAVERYLRRHGLRASKHLSQNHLVDGEVLEAIVEAAGAGPDRHVLEIGPGLGILTGALLRAGREVTAVEVDPRLVGAPARALRGRRPACGWSRGTSSTSPSRSWSSAPWDLVANLPYHITSPVLHQVLGDEPRPERFVLMVQREVAERIAVAAGRHELPLGLRAVPRRRARRAHRAAVRVRAGAGGRLGGPGRRDPAAAAAAAEARTTSGGWSRPASASGARCSTTCCRASCRRSGASAFEAALAAAGIAPDRRPQTLSVEEWLALPAALGPLDCRKR